MSDRLLGDGVRMTHVWVALLHKTVGLTLIQPISANDRVSPHTQPGGEAVLCPVLSRFLVSPVMPRHQSALYITLLVYKGKEL